jgi:hypothetical protein
MGKGRKQIYLMEQVTQAYSWTMVAELSNTNTTTWENSLATVMFNIFNTDNDSNNRLNAYYSDSPDFRRLGGIQGTFTQRNTE